MTTESKRTKMLGQATEREHKYHPEKIQKKKHARSNATLTAS